MTRVAIHGAAGRMGRNLVAACLDNPALQLTAALEHEGHAALGADAAVLAGHPEGDVAISADLASAAFDVAIDFSRPAGTLRLLEACHRSGAALVIGTTGLAPDERAEIGAAAREIPVVLAPNMGVGVNLLLGLVAQAARSLGDDYDIEVVEAHHRHKVDAPSGTALRLGEVAAEARGRSLDECGVFTRHGDTGERASGSIGFSTMRAGDIVGEHTVFFAGAGERIELTHRATSRMVFARGALRAAGWVVRQPPGLYDMQDVLGLGAGG